MLAKTMTLFIFLLILVAAISQNDNFYCWPESDRKVQTFINNNNTKLDHLPTIRFIQGYWDSQSALQYIGYLYLKEKMGLKVEFYPTIESGLTNDDLLTSPEYTYPDFYWQTIVDDKYDVLLENWPNNIPRIQEYFDRGDVIYGGLNDLYGEIGDYVPDYVYDELSEALLPQQLKHNNILRQQFIDAYTINSNKDWVKELNDTLYSNPQLLSLYLNKSFPLPNYNTPIIWGSSLTWIMSTYTNELTKRFQLYNDTPGIDWIFCPLFSENRLSEFIVDLYENKQPFIINHYSPHSDFATISKRTGKLMRFEQVDFKRN
eukprot:72802_1